MNNENMKVVDFVGYEYMDTTVDQSLETVYIDGYQNFGWTLDSKASGNLKFKRDRKIRNKAELARLQRQFENSVKEIEKLEKSKTAKASGVSFTVGLLGTVFMGGSVFAFLAAMLPFSIVLAVPGFIGWGIAYFLYKKVLTSNANKNAPLIERQYDVIYDTCQKANALVA